MIKIKIEREIKDCQDCPLYDRKEEEETNLYAYAEKDIIKTFDEIEKKYRIGD